MVYQNSGGYGQAHERSASIPPPTSSRSPRLNTAGGDVDERGMPAYPMDSPTGEYSPRSVGHAPMVTVTLSSDPAPQYLNRSASSDWGQEHRHRGPSSSSGSRSRDGGRQRGGPVYTNVHMRPPATPPPAPGRSSSRSLSFSDTTAFFVGTAGVSGLQPVHTGSPSSPRANASNATAFNNWAYAAGRLPTTTPGSAPPFMRPPGQQQPVLVMNPPGTRAPRDIRPTNSLSITRDGAAITGKYIVDPGLDVPEWFWGEDEPDEGNGFLGEGDSEKDRDPPNAKFVTRSGDVDVELWVCEGCVEARPSGLRDSVSSGDDSGVDSPRGSGGVDSRRDRWQKWDVLWSRGLDSGLKRREDADEKSSPSGVWIDGRGRGARVEVVSETGNVAMKLVSRTSFFFFQDTLYAYNFDSVKFTECTTNSTDTRLYPHTPPVRNN